MYYFLMKIGLKDNHKYLVLLRGISLNRMILNKIQGTSLFNAFFFHYKKHMSSLKKEHKENRELFG